MFGRRASGKASNGEVERSPEKMHGTDLAVKAGSEHRKDAIDLGQYPPEAGHGFLVVGGQRGVLVKCRYGIWNLNRLGINRYVDTESSQAAHGFVVEVRHGHGFQGEPFLPPVTQLDDKLVIAKVEVDLECAVLIGYG